MASKNVCFYLFFILFFKNELTPTPCRGPAFECVEEREKERKCNVAHPVLQHHFWNAPLIVLASQMDMCVHSIAHGGYTRRRSIVTPVPK